jgi:hypothetical protein
MDEVSVAKIIQHRIDNGPITNPQKLMQVTGLQEFQLQPTIGNIEFGNFNPGNFGGFTGGGFTIITPTDSINFSLKLEGLKEYSGYQIVVEYVYSTGASFGSIFLPSKKGTWKKTVGTSGESEFQVGISLYDGTFFPNQNFRILITSPQGSPVFDAKFQITDDEDIRINLPNLKQEVRYQIKITPPDADSPISFKNFKLLTETKVFRGTSRGVEKGEYSLLPDFEVEVVVNDINRVESVSFEIQTALGETINYDMVDGNLRTWEDLPFDNDAEEPVFEISLPQPTQIPTDVFLEEILEKSLDVWADHDLLVSYDILDQQTLEFVTRVEQTYSIRTNLNDPEKRGFAQIDLNYFGVVEVVELQVRSPRGEIIGKGSKTPQEIIANNNEVVIEVPPRRLAEIINLKLLPERPKKTVGRVLDLYGRKKYEDVQVIIYVAEKADPEESDYFPLLSVDTEEEGYFIIDTPDGFYEDAFALIGIVGEEKEEFRVPIRLEKDQVIINVQSEEEEEGQPNIIEQVEDKWFFPAQMLLVINPESDGLGKDEDCDCGDCKELDFHQERKVLEEFSFYSIVRTTEPEIQGYTLEEDGTMTIRDFVHLVEDYDLQQENLPADFLDQKIERKILGRYINSRKGISVGNLKKALTESRAQKLQELIRPTQANRAPGRQILDASNPIDWDEDPTIYQATTLAHGHILHFKQEWVNDGYSLGDLIYSLPLAPGQKKQIVTFDWERREAAAGVEALDYQESLQNTLSRDRDINEIVNGTIGEASQGGSTATTSSSSSASAAAGGLGFALGPIVIGGGGGGSKSSGRSSSSSNAWQRSSRNSTLSSLQQIRDRTRQSASAVRSMRSTVIQTASQGERFSVETETVANYNHCHALTIQYFEVLRHFKIRQRLADVRECLFIPLEMTTFDGKKALRWREVLSKYLLRDPFSRRLETRRLLFRSRNPLLKGFDAIERIENDYEGSDLPDGIYADETLDYLEGTIYLRFQLSRPKDDKDDDGNLIFLASAWGFMGKLNPALTAAVLHARYQDRSEANRDRAFQEEVAPQIAREFVERLKFEAILEDGMPVDLEMDPTLVSRYYDNRSLQVSLRMGSTSFEGLKRSDIRYIQISTTATDANGNQLSPSDLLPDNSRVIVTSGFMGYRSKNLSTHLFRNSRINNDLTETDGVLIYTPLNRLETRNPKEDDKEMANALVDHLNDNLEYYHNVIWMTMSPRRRFMFLDGIQVVDYSESDEYPEGVIRSVASVVENRVIGIEGNCLVMPVAPGFRLDPNTRGEEVDYLDLYKPLTPLEPINISVPTKGVFAEAVMGKCNSCEKKEEDRFWRWTEAPIPDSPTAIQPINTDSRRAQPLDTDPTQFPNPMIQIQNAPAVPDPSGFAALGQLLANPNFENITGLDANQRNALQSLLASFKTTTAFGEMATGLASTGMNLAAQLEAIKRGKENNLLSDDQAKKLSGKAIEKSIENSPDKKSVSNSLSDIKKVKEMVDQGTISGEKGDEIIKKLTDSIPDIDKKGTEGANDLIGKSAELIGSGKVDSVQAETTGADGTTAKVTLASNNTIDVPVTASDDFDELFRIATRFKTDSPLPGMRLRKSHRFFSGAEWTKFKDGILKMAAEPSQAGNASRYEDFVNIHVQAMDMANTKNWLAHKTALIIQHGRSESNTPTNFLAWHRIYLKIFEDELIALGGTPIPYWDWYNDRVIPAEMVDANMESKLGYSRNINSGAIPSTSITLAQSWKSWIDNPIWDVFQDQLEMIHHDPIHAHIGGNMGTASSPTDPIFWLHHAFVDKIWADYQRMTSNQVNPANPTSQLLPTAEFKNLTVQDALEYRTKMGYSYQEEFTILTSPSPARDSNVSFA